MAKKSAKSKGYRRQNGKKPYLSKKEIWTLCVLAALLAVGAFFLFRYDDGALKVQDGKVVTEGDNWLIARDSKVRRYYKLGEIGEMEGAAREKNSMSSDENLPEYVFTLEDTAEGIDSITVTCIRNPAEQLAKYTLTSLASLSEKAELSALQSAEMGGKTVHYYFYTHAAEAAETDTEAAEAPSEDAETAEAADTADAYTRTIAGYIDAPRNSSVVIHADGSGESAEACPTEEALLAALERAVATISLDEAE